MPVTPTFTPNQIQRHAGDILHSLIALTNCPIFDIDKIDTIDPLTKKTLIHCTTIIHNTSLAEEQ